LLVFILLDWSVIFPNGRSNPSAHEQNNENTEHSNPPPVVGGGSAIHAGGRRGGSGGGSGGGVRIAGPGGAVLGGNRAAQVIRRHWKEVAIVVANCQTGIGCPRCSETIWARRISARLISVIVNIRVGAANCRNLLVSK